MFMERVGPWRKKFAWIPTKMIDGYRIWRRSYHIARFQTKAHLDGPRIQSWVRSDTVAVPDADAYNGAMEDKRTWKQRAEKTTQELREREEQVDRYQQEQDELNVALSGVLDDQINSHATRLQAIHALRNRLMLLKRETSA